MASSKPIPCGPCQEGKVNTKADIWCYNCDEGLCIKCSGHHKRSKSSRDHKTIDIKSYKPSNEAIKTECYKHGQQFNLYCPSHLMPCCDECISKSHSKCIGIKSLASVVEKTKIGKSKESVEKDINSILQLLNKTVINKSSNIKSGEQQYEGIKESVVKIRKKINQHLDHLEKQLCREADNIWNQEKSTAKEFITEIEGKRTNLQKIKENLYTVETHSSKLQFFLGVHQIEQQVHHYQRYVEQLETDDRAKEFYIKMTKSNEEENILKQLRSLESIGKVTVVKTETDLNRETSVRREAQVQSREQSNIKDMTMNIETKIDINIMNYTSDMICLEDGRVIIVEIEGEIYLFNSDCKLQKQLPIPGDAFGVAQINQDTIAITYPEEKAIKIFDMENETVTKVITFDKKCYGLFFSNSSLAVGLNDYNGDDDDGEIRIIDLEGKKLNSIHVVTKSLLLSNIVYSKDRVIYSDYDGKAVYCVDGSGKQIWKYTQDLFGPIGLCIDTYGNIIVADFESSSILIISKDGQNSKVLISEEDELKKIRCICFKHNETSGFICDFDGIYMAKFNLVVR